MTTKGSLILAKQNNSNYINDLQQFPCSAFGLWGRKVDINSSANFTRISVRICSRYVRHISTAYMAKESSLMLAKQNNVNC